ncbi:30S ribosomal protein S6 [Firmicutes bacterium CAG:449]|nr:30S ribosomal protein S6 [Firmicutes bacterium CAG:449]
MKKYEIMYILKANLEDADRNQLIGKLHEILCLEGGKIENVNEWGLRDFAYEINGDKKGYYVVVTISTDSIAGINEFDRIAKINANVVRSLVIAK